VSTELGPFIIDASAEWYGTVDDYNIMEAPPSPNQTTGDTMQIALRTGNKSVVNYGAGIEYKLGEQTSFYGSFIIDKSSAPDSSAGTMTLATFDYVQLSAGAIFTLGRASITSGVAYITGSGPIRSNLEELVQSQLPGIGDELEVSARRVRVTVAFSYLIE
jgi:hypothetical protein